MDDFDGQTLLNFGGRELSDQEAQAHFAFVGTTGSGKTLQLRMLMQSVLPQIGTGTGRRALLYDAKQDLMSQLSAYCDRGSIRTLNPDDDRGAAWDIAADVTEPRIAMEIAFTLIPESSESQPYFANASRHILYGIMASFLLSQLDWSLADLLRVASDSRLSRRVLSKHPETSGIIRKYFSDKRLLNDIFSTLASKTLLYEPIAGCWEAASERVSLNDWASEEMILILGNSEISRAAIDSINRCIFKRASDITLMNPERTKEQTWFFIDEVSEAGRLTSLPSLLKKGRSKGARVAIAFQSISGLRDPKLFGQYVTDDILGQIGNRFFGRIECPETAEYASRVIGDQEIQQISRSSTSSQQGGSTTTNWSPSVRKAVLPSEFMSIAACGPGSGLMGVFTTRSSLPTWDYIDPKTLFNELIVPPAEDVPDFVRRETKYQFIQPWTEEEENYFAPRIEKKKELDLNEELGLKKRRNRRRDDDSNSLENN